MPNCEDFIKHTDTQFEQAENELKGKSDDEKKDIIQSAWNWHSSNPQGFK